MNFELVYDNSGDTLPFVAVNPDLAEYYIHAVQAKNVNNFSRFGQAVNEITTLIHNLNNTVLEINKFIHLYIGYKLPVLPPDGYLDQAALNKYHADWANSHEIMFNIDDMLKHSDPDVRAEFEKVNELYPTDIRDATLSSILNTLGKLDVYEQINIDIHYLEASFRKVLYEAHGDEYYTVIKNSFDESIITNDICNLKISYHVKGRTLYDKFLFFDNDLEYCDENNHTTQSTRLELNLAQPQTIPLSAEYKQWCQSHDRYPTGDFLNLGNIVDIQNKVTDYRQIVYRNLVSNNNCKLELKGE